MEDLTEMLRAPGQKKRTLWPEEELFSEKRRGICYSFKGKTLQGWTSDCTRGVGGESWGGGIVSGEKKTINPLYQRNGIFTEQA